MPMTLRKWKIRKEIFQENFTPPKKKTLVTKTRNKVSSSSKKLKASGSETKDVSRSERISSLRRTNVVELVGNGRRTTRVPYSLTEIQNWPIGSMRREDPRNSLFNFTTKRTQSSSRGENARKKLNLSRNQTISIYNITRPVSSGLAGPKTVNRDVTLTPSTSRIRKAPRCPRAPRRLRRGGISPAPSLIYHLPDEDRYEVVADGVTFCYSSSPDKRLSVGRISMQPFSWFENTEMRTNTTVYTVLKGHPTFFIRNLGVNDKGRLGSAFTNPPGSTLRIRNGNTKALISFATFHLKKPKPNRC